MSAGTSTRAVLDVSALPTHEHGPRTLLWAGQVWMMVIEGTMFALAFAAYFYLRAVADVWPPANVPLPGLWAPSLLLVLLLASIVPTKMSSHAADAEDPRRLFVLLVILSAFEVAAVGVRSVELSSLGVKWYDYAYGSVVWLLIGLHTFHLVVSTAETIVLTVTFARRPVMSQQYLATRVDGLYWYWLIGWDIALYLVVDLSPRLHL